MAFTKQQPPPAPAPLPGKQTEPPAPNSIGKPTPGKIKGKGPQQRTTNTKKPSKAPPPRKADSGSSNENNQLARQVADRLRLRDKRQFGGQ